MIRRWAPLMFTAFCVAGCGQGPDSAADAVPRLDVAGAQQAAEPGTVPAGRAVYQEFCASCHDTGLEGAPVTGDPADWEDRSDLWQAVLMEHAKAGYLKMPARGGDAELSDLAVSQAVEYMLLVTYPDRLPD